jgi:hypothetical protein
VSRSVRERLGRTLLVLRGAPRRLATRAAHLRESLRPVAWRLTGLAVGLLFYALAWTAVIAALVAGGNWLQHWLGIERPSPKFTEPVPSEPREPSEPEQP